MSFKDMQGQDKAISNLRHALENGRVSHGYLFLGPDGVGKKMAAMNFAKALNCKDDKIGGSCDSCVSCMKIDAGSHPDVLFLKPEKVGASIKIEKVRELIRSLSLKPYEGRNKVFIIDDADAMGHEAQNALLKTLEEPPAESILILMTSNAKGLFETIVSRLQIVKFFPLRVETVKDILVRTYKMDEVTANVLSRLSSGRLGEALKYKDEDFSNKRSRIIKGLMDKTFFDSDFDGLSREELKSYLEIMLSWYRDLLVTKARGGPGDGEGLLNIDKKDALAAGAKDMGFEQLDETIRQIILTSSFLEQNANAKLAMGVLGVNICMK